MKHFTKIYKNKDLCNLKSLTESSLTEPPTRSEVKEFFKNDEIIHQLNTNNFDKLYSAFEDEHCWNHLYVLTGILFTAGINPIPYFKNSIPEFFMACTSNNESVAKRYKFPSIILISSNIKSIGRYSFSETYGIKKVIIQTGVLSIGEYAFCDSKDLQEVYIPSSVKDIERWAFDNTKCDIYIDRNEKSLDDLLQ